MAVSTFTNLGIKALPTNPNVGSLTLVAGAATVAKTDITAQDKVFLTRSAAAGTISEPTVTVTAGTGFAVDAVTTQDLSTFDYFVLRTVP